MRELFKAAPLVDYDCGFDDAVPELERGRRVALLRSDWKSDMLLLNISRAWSLSGESNPGRSDYETDLNPILPAIEILSVAYRLFPTVPYIRRVRSNLVLVAGFEPATFRLSSGRPS